MHTPADHLTYLQEYLSLQLGEDPISALSLWAKYFTHYREDGRYDICRRLLQGIKRNELPLYGMGIVKYGEGWFYDRLGWWQGAIHSYDACLQAFHQVGIFALDADLWSNIGSIYQDRGQWSEAEQAYQKARVIAEEQKDRKALGHVLNNLSGLYQEKEQPEIAQGYLRTAIEILQEEGDLYNAAAALAGLGTLYTTQNRPQDALNSYMEAITEFQKLGNLHGVGMVSASIARLYQLVKKLPEAKLQYQEALIIFRQLGDLIQSNKTLANLGLIAQEEGDINQAKDYFEQALKGYQEFGDVHGATICLVSLGYLHYLIGSEQLAIKFALEAFVQSKKYNFIDQITRMKLIFPEKVMRKIQSRAKNRRENDSLRK